MFDEIFQNVKFYNLNVVLKVGISGNEKLVCALHKTPS